ncbi:MAG: tRNA (adenosine(37)-N6)-dimethylallyltransferase MiaA [Verrucomicrobiae bacterium]|nr:tRNA (adenosine(37)-N6)-dimethylallyltransferase MiaA [Verrucomicrobiae bacterium]MDW8343096.1 tRNA (adenosine(37)-N6)-dimethylallyltransferase MiaA [Verrucomicrobiae bacterium]
MRTVFLVGPTAVGKTAVALELARRWDAEIVTADAMQVYRGMDIGTAKPSAAERLLVPHHLLDVCEPGEHFDVQRYVELAQQALAEIQRRGKIALVVGGTGLYIRALRFGLFSGPGQDPVIRRKLEALSAGELYAALSRVDSTTAAVIDRHNPRRLVRALEVALTTGRSMRACQQQWRREPVIPGPVLGLRRERADLVERIERRVDEQLQAGWLDEVRRLMPLRGTAAQAIGYRELAAHLRGEISLAEAVTQIKARTRQFARRQMTWFRREPGLIWIDVKGDEPVAEIVGRLIRVVEAA